jgi:hypothetical protein
MLIRADVRFGSLADICSAKRHARFGPIATSHHSLDHLIGAGAQALALASPLTAAKGASVILDLNQYKCIGCSPGNTRTIATGSDDDSLGEEERGADSENQ